MLESQFIEFISQSSLSVCLNSIKKRINKGKLRKKIQRFTKMEFTDKFFYLDLSSEIDFGGLSDYLNNSLLHELENYITAPNENNKKSIISKACNSAKADSPNKQAIVVSFIESVTTIIKQDFISNVDKSFRIFANNLKNNLFDEIKSEILENTDRIMGGISTLNANDDIIISNQAVEISQLNKLCDDVGFIKSEIEQQSVERNAATNVSISNPLNLLRDFGVSVSSEDSVNSTIKYSSNSEIINIRFCVKRKGRIAEFASTDEYLANLSYTMIEDTVDVISSVIIQNGKKTEHNYDDNYMGAVCYLPWLSFTEMEIHSSGLNRFTDLQCISSKLTIVPKQIQITYNIENGSREMMWQGIKYKLHRSIENNNRCCYYENEAGYSRIKINIMFAFETISQEEERIVVNPRPDITLSIAPLDNYNARSLLEYYQALKKLKSSDMLKFVDIETTEVDFSCTIDASDFDEHEIISTIDIYNKIIDIEDYFKIEFKLEFPINADLCNHINMIHGLIKNKKFITNHSRISLITHLEPHNMNIGSSYGWVAQAIINKQLFDKELPLENVVMVCPNTKYINQDGDSAVLEIIDKTIYFWDTNDKIYSNLNIGFNKVLETVGYDCNTINNNEQQCP